MEVVAAAQFEAVVDERLVRARVRVRGGDRGRGRGRGRARGRVGWG